MSAAMTYLDSKAGAATTVSYVCELTTHTEGYTGTGLFYNQAIPHLIAQECHSTSYAYTSASVATTMFIHCRNTYCTGHSWFQTGTLGKQ